MRIFAHEREDLCAIEILSLDLLSQEAEHEQQSCDESQCVLLRFTLNGSVSNAIRIPKTAPTMPAIVAVTPTKRPWPSNH